MWKQFTRAASGSSPEYWDGNWEKVDALLPDRDNDRICENQGVVWRLLNRHVERDRLFLEGGCGCANWVRYFAGRGYRAVGLDFASRTVEKVKQLAPGVDVRLGDVAAMPFETGSIHSYYSAGVVEHFQEGPEAALHEARRVLAKDGWFFCSVPDATTLRRTVVWPTRKLTRSLRAPVRKVESTAIAPPLPDHEFFQYYFTPAEFTTRLEAAGFRVEQTVCTSLLWGLMELPAVGLTLKAATRPRRRSQASGQAAPVASSPSSSNGGSAAGNGPRPSAKALLRSSFERLLLKEDVTLPVVGPILNLALEHCGNMRLYVARPR